jgi:hypothetical protein
MPRTHTYDVSVAWTGNRGTGTSGYRAYGRDHEVTADGELPGPHRAGDRRGGLTWSGTWCWRAGTTRYVDKGV